MQVGITQYSLRLPTDVHATFLELAIAHRRSLRQEMVLALEAWIKQHHGDLGE